VIREDVGDHGHIEKPVQVGRVGDDEDVVDHLADDTDHALDEAPAAELDQGFGRAAHARALAAGLHYARHAHRVTAPLTCTA